MKLNQSARYVDTLECVRQEDDLIAYGITDHAQDQLSDLVFVELPEVGDSFDKGDIILCSSFLDGD